MYGHPRSSLLMVIRLHGTMPCSIFFPEDNGYLLLCFYLIDSASDRKHMKKMRQMYQI